MTDCLTDRRCRRCNIEYRKAREAAASSEDREGEEGADQPAVERQPAPPPQSAASEQPRESNPGRRPSRCASQIATLAAATRISPYQRMGNPNRLNATGSGSMTNGMVVPPRPH